MAETIDFPLQFKRQYDGPLDTDTVFNSIGERLSYLGNTRRYPGQIMGDAEANRAYMINKSNDGYVPLTPQIIGNVQLFAGISPPNGWMWCDGSSLLIANNSLLYAVIGSTHGGDGATYFCLPILTGMGPHPDINFAICTDGILPTS
jgi:hypothetical protein